LTYCARSGAHCHVIDPCLPGNYDEIQPLLERHGEMHQDASLNVLHRLPADLFLIDGDHNWYTVYHELLAIERAASESGRAFPVLLVHDVMWPYGRRDLYYDDSSIPRDYVHPAARSGIVPGREGLVDGDGLNGHLLNAQVEGGKRNGVLTAVEDFLQLDGRCMSLATIPGFSGLAVVVDDNALAQSVRAGLHELFDISEPLAAHLQSLELDRIRRAIDARKSGRQRKSRGSWLWSRFR
jgi:hypothetical protein